MSEREERRVGLAAQMAWDKGYERGRYEMRGMLLADLRAQVEALPRWDKRTVPGGFHVNRSAVLALLQPAPVRTVGDAVDAALEYSAALSAPPADSSTIGDCSCIDAGANGHRSPCRLAPPADSSPPAGTSAPLDAAVLAKALYVTNAAAIPDTPEWRERLLGNARDIAREYAALLQPARSEEAGKDPIT